MITVLTLISLGFVCIQLLNATLNLIFRQKLSKTAPNIPSLISVLIPVRNEELNIIALLNSLKEINTPLIEIIVFNDQSTDNTAAILQECSKSDPRIRTISADSLPPGWLGQELGMSQAGRCRQRRIPAVSRCRCHPFRQYNSQHGKYHVTAEFGTSLYFSPTKTHYPQRTALCAINELYSAYPFTPGVSAGIAL